MDIRPGLIIGPHFVHSEAPAITASGLEYLGIGMEFAGESSSGKIPLYARSKFKLPIPGWKPSSEMSFGEVLLPAKELSISFEYSALLAEQTGSVEFLPLEAFLVGLYRYYQVARPIFTVLTELASVVPLQYNVSRAEFVPGCLVSVLEERGFRVATVAKDDVERLVEIAWLSQPPDGRGTPFHVCVMRVGPKTCQLLEPRSTGVCSLLVEPLIDHSSNPADWFTPSFMASLRPD